MPGFNLNGFLPYQLAVLAARTSRGFAQRYQAEFDISIPEWRVLAHLSQHDAVSVREIHARVDMDKSKVSRAATRLETRGLVTKTAGSTDKRLVELTLTAQGKDLMSRITPMADDFSAEIEARLGPDAPAFRAALVKLIETTPG